MIEREGTRNRPAKRALDMDSYIAAKPSNFSAALVHSAVVEIEPGIRVERRVMALAGGKAADFPMPPICRHGIVREVRRAGKSRCRRPGQGGQCAS